MSTSSLRPAITIQSVNELGDEPRRMIQREQLVKCRWQQPHLLSIQITKWHPTRSCPGLAPQSTPLAFSQTSETGSIVTSRRWSGVRQTDKLLVIAHSSELLSPQALASAMSGAGLQTFYRRVRSNTFWELGFNQSSLHRIALVSRNRPYNAFQTVAPLLTCCCSPPQLSR